MTHKIIITPALDGDNKPRHNSRGPLYDVAYNGKIIVTSTTEPCLDGARALKALGCSGKLELWDDVTPYVRLTADIDKAAQRTIREGDEPPRLVKYVPFAPRSAEGGDLASGATFIPPSVEKPSLDSPGRIVELSTGGFESIGAISNKVLANILAGQQREAA